MTEDSDSLAGQVAVITGGSGGIGRASAELWLARGGLVVCADIDVASGEAFAAQHPSGRVRFVRVDTRMREDVLRAIELAQSMGRFSCMFNNAGVGAVTDTLEEALETTEPGGVANTEYSLDDAKKVIEEAKM